MERERGGAGEKQQLHVGLGVGRGWERKEREDITSGFLDNLRSLPRDFSGSFYKLLKTFLFDRAWLLGVCVCVFVRMCVFVCVRICVCCVRACMYVCVIC